MISVLRFVAAAIVGVIAWFALATAINLVFRAHLAGYAAAEPGFAFTTAMLVARLTLGVACSVVAGLVAAWVAARRDRGVYAVSASLLILFVPQHVQLWPRFPVWYHATFLASLLVATWLGLPILGTRASASAHPCRHVPRSFRR